MSFWVKTNYFVKKVFPKYVWDIANRENKVFLTFDDGPTPEITEWVLEQLKEFDAKATFFCIGVRVLQHPVLAREIVQRGHRIENHSHAHRHEEMVHIHPHVPDAHHAHRH